MPRIRRNLTARALAVCALLVFTGCSGGDDDDNAAPTTSTQAAAAPTTVRPVDTSFSGQNSAQFCARARTYGERSQSLGANPTPAQLRTAAREGQAAITDAVNAAPAEIKPDVEVLARAFADFLAELEKVDFVAARVPPEAVQSLQSPEFTQATTRFQAYVSSVCEIN